MGGVHGNETIGTKVVHNILSRFMNEELRPAVYYFVRFRIESDRTSDDLERVTGKELAVNPGR